MKEKNPAAEGVERMVLEIDIFKVEDLKYKKIKGVGWFPLHTE